MSAVSIESVKAHLRIMGDEDDALLAQKIAAAEAHVEAFIGQAVASIPVTDEGGHVVMKVPADLEEAILRQVAEFFDGTPAEIGDILNRHRAWAF